MKTLITPTQILILFIATLSFQSCRKGDQDPLFSIESRKSRLAGEWVISNAESKTRSVSTPSVGDASITESKEIINGKEITFENITTTGSKTKIITETGDVKYTAVFTEEGTFELSKEYTVQCAFEQTDATSSVQLDMIRTIETGENVKRTRTVTEKQTGSWNFLGSVESDYSADQRIVLNILNVSTHQLISDNKKVVTTSIINDVQADTTFRSTTIGEPFTTNTTTDSEVSYMNGENSQVWDLSRLTNDEVIAGIDMDNKQSSSSSFTSTQNGANTYTGNTVSTTGSNQVTLRK